MERDKIWHYDNTAIFLHWIIAALLIGLVSLGWYMVSIANNPESGFYFNLHKSFGLIAAGLIFYRVIWRLTHHPAPLSFNVPHWQARLSRIIHFLLYFCMILMPMTGILGASFSQYGLVFFGLQLPTWINQNQELSKQLFNIHGLVAWCLVGLVSLHILAAVKHVVIDKENVFRRMWR